MAGSDGGGEVAPHASRVRLARRVLVAFIITFAIARILVLLIMSRRLPDLYLYIGGTHVHHLNSGIFILSIVGGYLLLGQPPTRYLRGLSTLYGVGLALTFDEFGMWLHLGGAYWQRASFDAIGIIGAVLGLIAIGPKLSQFRPRHWWSALSVAVVLTVFGILLVESVGQMRRRFGPALQRMEESAPAPQPSRANSKE